MLLSSDSPLSCTARSYCVLTLPACAARPRRPRDPVLYPRLGGPGRAGEALRQIGKKLSPP